MENDETTKCVVEERRKRNRYLLEVPVTFSWREAGQTQHKEVGLTRDISINGAFVLTKSPPGLKAKIKLKLFFPLVGREATPLQMHGEGQVVRVEAVKHDEATDGFAVAGKRFVLRRGEEYR